MQVSTPTPRNSNTIIKTASKRNVITSEVSECRLDVVKGLSENTGPKCKEVTGGYRKVYTVKLRNKYSLRNIIILFVDKIVYYIHAREREDKCIVSSFGKPQEEGPVGRSWFGYKYNVSKECCVKLCNGIHAAQDGNQWAGYSEHGNEFSGS
jgi:hypothetical protein